MLILCAIAPRATRAIERVIVVQSGVTSFNISDKPCVLALLFASKGLKCAARIFACLSPFRCFSSLSLCGVYAHTDQVEQSVKARAKNDPSGSRLSYIAFVVKQPLLRNRLGYNIPKLRKSALNGDLERLLSFKV
jgi:hypothetical protein